MLLIAKLTAFLNGPIQQLIYMASVDIMDFIALIWDRLDGRTSRYVNLDLKVNENVGY